MKKKLSSSAHQNRLLREELTHLITRATSFRKHWLRFPFPGLIKPNLVWFVLTRYCYTTQGGPADKLRAQPKATLSSIPTKKIREHSSNKKGSGMQTQKPFHRPLLLIKCATFTRVCIFLSLIALDNLENTSYIYPQMF